MVLNINDKKLNDDKKVETESFILNINKQTIMLETCSDVFVDDNIKSFMKKYRGIDKLMEGNGFSFNFFDSLSIRCYKLNQPKVSLYIESTKGLRCKNAAINPKNINDRYFQYAFELTQHHKEITNYPEHVSKIKLFLDLYNQSGKEYTTIVNKKKLLYLKKKNNPNIALTL